MSEEEEASFHRGCNSLSGILNLPDGEGPLPAMVLLNGSYRVPGNNYKETAHELVKAGYAVLRNFKSSKTA